MAKRKQLGSSAAIHTQRASKASDEIDKAAVLIINKARNNKCTSATVAYAEMQQAIGRYRAHVESGGNAWMNKSAVEDAAYEYNQHCVRESTHAVGRRRRRR